MTVTCSNGHVVTTDGAFCSQCGAPTTAGEAASQNFAGFTPPAAPPTSGPPGYGPPSGPPAGYYPPGYPPTGYPPVATGTNGLAIASLILGILWFWGVGSLLALIFGLVGRKQIGRSGGRQGGNGLAIAGIVLGAVGIVGAILLTVILAAASNTLSHNAVAACRADYKTVEVADEAYKAQMGTYPANVDVLTQTATGQDGSSVGPWLNAPPVNPGHYEILTSNGRIGVFTTDSPPTQIGSSTSEADCASVS